MRAYYQRISRTVEQRCSLAVAVVFGALFGIQIHHMSITKGMSMLAAMADLLLGMAIIVFPFVILALAFYWIREGE